MGALLRGEGSRGAEGLTTDTDRVAPGDGCPKCGNDEVDALVIVEDPEQPIDHVHCLKCGHFYTLPE